MFDDEPADGLEGPDGGDEPRNRDVSPDESSASASAELPIGPNAALEFHRRARLAEDRLAEVLAAYRQVKTENEDYRDRTTRNIERRFEQRRERLLLKFMDILDNLDRALDAAEHAGNPLIEGLILVRTQLLQTLQEEGLERIPSLGMAFDPAVAESVGSQPVTEPEHHHVVVKELLRGYRLNGRIARASRVVIGVYTAAAEPEDEGLIGADEVAPPLLTAEPLLEPMGLAPDEPVEPLPDVIGDPPGMDPLLEPTLEPVPDDEGRSLEEIIAAAERQEAAAASTEGQAGEDELVPAVPLPDGEGAAEPADEDSLFRDAFGANLRPEPIDD
ncbi:MAG TPA: nucleotide exchange factor GrpE [Vicinamibacteria bacterium]